MNINDCLTQVVSELTTPNACDALLYHHTDGHALPSLDRLNEVIGLCRAILFPGYFGHSGVSSHTIAYHTGVNVESLFYKLTEQIQAGLCFDEEQESADAAAIASQFIERLPHLRRLLATDVVAAYEGDPAATSYGEVISCYPAIRAISNYRIAHELHLLGVPLIPRIITEMAHSETGVDIHPAATIGSHFTIDHGTGVVIGATSILGNHVKLYQGVTLGAKSFPLDEQGNPIKGIDRHPILEDNVIVYSNSTILGRITIGKDAVIGGNVWVTEDVEPGAKVLQRR
ncbi:MAG: serine acetyltransferase [Bacteroidaceae bacterium]|nr:serine acetyltransferase [Bacteroidaceae bacterium]